MPPPAPPVNKLIRKRDEKREMKMGGGYEAHSSGVAASSDLRSKLPKGTDLASYTHYVDQCEECKSKELVIK
jgi:hypothetical protein